MKISLKRIKVTDKFIDLTGNQKDRASGDNFTSLQERHIQVVMDLLDPHEDETILTWLAYANSYYDKGNYVKAFQYLLWIKKNKPVLKPYINYYLKVCERVLSTPLTDRDILYENELNKYKALPNWLKWSMKMPLFIVRCKWCGSSIRYINPDIPTFGFDTIANSCSYCGRMYPMPSWPWDSPDGRAYSYYRMSFQEGEFYEEFEKDYEPDPLCNRRQLK